MTTELPVPYDELPLWMRQAKQEFDWSILIIIAMSLAIGWTFLINTDLPAGNQLEHIVFQANDIATGFQEGIFYPRWSAYALEGYGAPIPNYYPMGTSYTVAVVSAIFTNDILQATRVLFIMAYVLAGLGVYLYLSRRTDSAIGLLGSVLYLFSPMIGSTVPHAMGDLALLLASGLLPLTLWTSYRLTTFYRSGDLVLHCFIIGYLVWIHPQMAMVSILLTFVLSLCGRTSISRFQRCIRLLFANMLGILLVSYFWMPALFERDLVEWYSTPTFHVNILTLEQLISPIQQIDSGLLVPQAQFKLGWILIVFFILGIVTTVRLKETTLSNIFTFFIAISLVLIGVLILPTETWLLAPVTLLMSLLGAQVLYLRRLVSAVQRRLLLTISIGITVIFTQPVWLVPPHNLTIEAIDAIAQIRFEQQGYGVPILPDNSSLPATLSPDVPANRSLVNSYIVSAPQRYDESQNNANTIVSLLRTSTHQQIYRLFNQFPTELEFILPYFDGWQAYIDGTPITTFGNPDNNLLTITVPVVADGELIITLTATPTRQLAWIISTLTLFIVLLFGIRLSRDTNRDSDTMLINTLPRTDIRLLLTLFISLGFIIIIVGSETSPFQLQPQPTFSLAQSLPIQSRSSAGFEAGTFTINRTMANIGDTIEVTVYWQALTDISANYRSRVRLRSAENSVIWYTGPLQPIGTIPTRRWLRNLFVEDRHTFTIPEDIFAGDYNAEFEVFPCPSTCDLNSPARFFDLNGEQTGRRLIIPLSITVR